jgi:hypothetical protein
MRWSRCDQMIIKRWSKFSWIKKVIKERSMFFGRWSQGDQKVIRRWSKGDQKVITVFWVSSFLRLGVINRWSKGDQKVITGWSTGDHGFLWETQKFFSFLWVTQKVIRMGSRSDQTLIKHIQKCPKWSNCDQRVIKTTKYPNSFQNVFKLHSTCTHQLTYYGVSFRICQLVPISIDSQWQSTNNRHPRQPVVARCSHWRATTRRIIMKLNPMSIEISSGRSSVTYRCSQHPWQPRSMCRTRSHVTLRCARWKRYTDTTQLQPAGFDFRGDVVHTVWHDHPGNPTGHDPTWQPVATRWHATVRRRCHEPPYIETLYHYPGHPVLRCY